MLRYSLQTRLQYRSLVHRFLKRLFVGQFLMLRQPLQTRLQCRSLVRCSPRRLFVRQLLMFRHPLQARLQCRSLAQPSFFLTILVLATCSFFPRGQAESLSYQMRLKICLRGICLITSSCVIGRSLCCLGQVMQVLLPLVRSQRARRLHQYLALAVFLRFLVVGSLEVNCFQSSSYPNSRLRGCFVKDFYLCVPAKCSVSLQQAYLVCVVISSLSI